MFTATKKINRSFWQTCRYCGRRFRMLGDRRSLGIFLADESMQRRAFQCINCGDVICRECHESGATCACRSNAWLAKPYLDLSVTRSAE